MKKITKKDVTNTVTKQETTTISACVDATYGFTHFILNHATRNRKNARDAAASVGYTPMSPRTVRRRTKKKSIARRTSASRMVERVTSWNLGTQIAIAVSAMMVLALLGMIDRNVFSAALGNAEKAAPEVSIDIGLEHDGPVDLGMLVARKGTAGLIEVNNTSNAPLKISLPEGWERTEVRGGSIWLITEEDPEFGYIRWMLPPKMGMTLRTTSVPDVITYHSPSGQTASIRVTSVDVETSAKNQRTLLFQNAAQVKLWIADE